MLKSGYAQTSCYLETKRPFSLQFMMLDPTTINNQSVVNVKNDRIYESINKPTFEGVNDPRMGVFLDSFSHCMTCRGTQADCPGHFGHIDLARPVYHPGVIDHVVKLLRCVCYNCSRILAPRSKAKIDMIKKIKQSKSRFIQVQRLCESQEFKVCDLKTEGCGYRQPKFWKKKMEIMIEHDMQDESYTVATNQSLDRKQPLLPQDALKVLSKITEGDQEVLGCRKPENLILKKIPVAPPCVRPSISLGGNLRQEDDLTYCYQKIVQHNNLLQNQINKGANPKILEELRQVLQFSVATLIDNQIPGLPNQRHKNGRCIKAFAQRLKGKEGRVRGNLMGKRVDFSARTVITPDPNLRLNQLGVPLRIAMNMTIPETVTRDNMDEMRNLINNGPFKYPGAKYIIRDDNRMIDIGMMANRCDAHLERGYKVERHMRDGDMVALNRQPSLHKMSIMGHQAKILPGATFRLNLSTTTPYNADFDGDEMNMYVPQSYETLAEVKELMHVPLQIVSPQSNKPVMGIVQDALLGIMLFTLRDNFMDREMVMDLMMWIGDENERSLPQPAILKPKALWTGKQILSLVLPNVNMVKFLDDQQPKDKDTGKIITNWCSPKDSIVIIDRGELICGYLNKRTAGSAANGLIHLIWRECGPYAAQDFLSNAQNVINQWLIFHGFTVGIQDTVSTEWTKHSIKKKLNELKVKVQKVIRKSQNGKLKCQPGKNMMESFEAEANQKLNNGRDDAGRLAFKELDPNNKIQQMVTAGSKGTNINLSQIIACVGQQNVEGKRIPFGFSKRSLPHFNVYDYGPESKGFVFNNYNSGLTPSEFFFHAMGGREGLIDTAVKTSETGYIQRRLMKALEDVQVKYDSSVRNSNEQVIQFLYGEDGMAAEQIEDVNIELLKWSDADIDKKCSFLPKKATSAEIETILKQYMDPISNIQEILNTPAILLELVNEVTRIREDRDKLRRDIIKDYEPFIHLPINLPRLIMNCRKQFEIKPYFKSNLTPLYVIKEVQKLLNELTVFPGRQGKPLGPHHKEANENSVMLIKIYFRYNLNAKKLIQKERLNVMAFNWLIGEIKSRFESSLVHPGEMVGSIAAQSLGEPATQMTLNTFHFAGVSSKNVTLGVPRLKEVINVAKNIKTPNCTIYLRPEHIKSENAVMEVQGYIEHTTLGQVIESSQIYFDPDFAKTIIAEDKFLVDLYNQVPDVQHSKDLSPWVLRFVLSQEKMINKQLDIDQIKDKLISNFGDIISIMSSDQNAENAVLRLRFRDIQEDDGSADDAVPFIKEIEDTLLHELTIKGFPEITKVYAKKYKEKEYSTHQKEFKVTDDNWMLETDGVALQKILAVDKVDHRRTISNDIIEILNVLGVEAARASLINELRNVLNFYGIYVNYRHLATLGDIMTQKGRLTSITRHGINRLDSGPLRKCSFEETVEILTQAAIFSETDPLRGVTENIMFGQLAPLGSGSFDLVLDEELMAQNIQAGLEDEMMAGQLTPIYDEPYLNGGNMTPFPEGTPNLKRMGSEYCQTPAGGYSMYDMSFSPAPMALASPNYYSPAASSPQYNPASPIYSPSGYNRHTSPIYNNIYNPYQSPIYQVSNEATSPKGTTSPGRAQYSNHSQSPMYSPTNTANLQSPYQATVQGPMYSPSFVGSQPANSPVSTPHGQSPVSPHYSPLGSKHDPYGKSPNYSPNQTLGDQRSSPTYSPTTPGMGGSSSQGKRYSPSYSPTSPAYNPAYHPSYHPSQQPSPRYSTNRVMAEPNRPPTYIPTSPAYPTNSGEGQSSRSGTVSNFYIPQTESYKGPSSPQYGGMDELSNLDARSQGSVIEQNSEAMNREPQYNPECPLTKEEDEN